MQERREQMSQVVTEALLLGVTESYPKRLEGIVERIRRYRRPISYNEALRAVDFLESRDMILMRIPSRGGSRTLFIAKTAEVPDDPLGLIHKLMALHGIPRK